MKKYENGSFIEITDGEIEALRIAESQAILDDKSKFEAMPYPERVEYLIRKRYTISDELAILRQREDKPEEFEEYNEFAEECKRIAAGSEP